MADFSMSDMPWLGQPADPAGSLLRGVQAGAAISGARTQRAALAQRKMEFDQERSMAERNWRERMAVLPLEMTLKQQQNQIDALKIQDVLEGRQQKIKNDADFVSLSQLVPKAFSEAGGYETVMQLGIEAITKNPYLATDPRFKGLFDTITKAQEATESMMRAEAYRARVDTASGNLDLALKREDRLGDMFEFQKQKFAADIPRDRLSLFNARAQVIKNDLNLIGNTAEQVRQLNELAKEFGVGMPVTAVPSTTPPAPGKKIGRFEVVPK